MSLTAEQFDALVARLELQAARRPELYKLTLGAFAALGYIYIFGILLLLIAVAGGLIAILIAGKALVLGKLVVPVFVLIITVVRALWVKLAVPQGVSLTKEEYPALFAAIDEVRRATHAPAAHEVLLTHDLNAAIVQIPRLGLFGWQKNYLLLGLPLLQMLSVDEFKAVLAHEYGHLSGAHGRFGAWIYRVRAGWEQLAATLKHNRQWGQFLFVPFFDWYAPTFAAHSFVQARAQEYEADRLAATTIGAAPLANALVRLKLKGDELDHSYWPGILKAADDQPAPKAAPFRGLMSVEQRGFLPQAAEQLRQALERKTGTDDTHPCLRDRIAALELSPGMPQPLGVSAAETLLGGTLGPLVERFDAEWQAAVAGWWRERHEHVRTARARLAGFDARPHEELSDVELYEYALLIEEFGDSAKAFELQKELVLQRGATKGAKFAYARMLLERGDESAIRMLNEVMRELPELTLPSCALIVSYLHAHGRQAEARPYIDRITAQQARHEEAQAARATHYAKDVWLTPALGAEALASVRASLERHRRDLKQAYLVRKQLPPGEPPLHVVGVLRRRRWYRYESDKENRQLVHEIAQEVRSQEEIQFIWLNDKQNGFRKAFKKVAGARIF
jgi:Zn-dependent protease with chaperone function